LVGVGFTNPCPSGLLFFPIDEYAVASKLDVPTRQWIKRRSLKSFARSQIEAGMMPRTPDRIAGYESFAEGTMVMRTGGSYGKELISDAREQNLLSIDMADQCRSVRKVVNR
jgi:hypothetical protein